MFLFSTKWTRLSGDGKKKRDVLDRDILCKIIRILNHRKFDMYWKLHYFVGEIFCLIDMLYFYFSACLNCICGLISVLQVTWKHALCLKYSFQRVELIFNRRMGQHSHIKCTSFWSKRENTVPWWALELNSAPSTAEA